MSAKILFVLVMAAGFLAGTLVTYLMKSGTAGEKNIPNLVYSYHPEIRKQLTAKDPKDSKTQNKIFSDEETELLKADEKAKEASMVLWHSIGE